MHPNQLFRRHSLSHSLFAGLGRTRSSLQLSIGVLHGLFPAFGEVTAEGLDLRVGAAEFLDHAVDLFQLHGVVPRYGDGLLVGIQNDFHVFFLLFVTFYVETSYLLIFYVYDIAVSRAVSWHPAMNTR